MDQLTTKWIKFSDLQDDEVVLEISSHKEDGESSSGMRKTNKQNILHHHLDITTEMSHDEINETYCRTLHNYKDYDDYHLFHLVIRDSTIFGIMNDWSDNEKDED